MNIPYQYSKIFKVNFYEVVYAIFTLCGIDITKLGEFFFFVTATAV